MLRKSLFLASLFWSACAFAQPALSSGEHKTKLNGVELWYKVAGTSHPGEAPLLFLHGGPGYNSYSFEKTIGAQLESHVQMLYLDERGSGRSERPRNHDYDMATLVADVEALRVSLGLATISLMGHSFGGTIALEYAARYPQHVQKLVILDGAADMPATFHLWREEIERRYPTAWRSTLDGPAGKRLRIANSGRNVCAIAKAEFGAAMTTLQSVDGQAFRNWQQFHDQNIQQQQDALDRASGLQNTGEISNAYFREESDFPCYRFSALSRVTMPTLIVVGKYDGAIGVKQMQNLAKHLPDARFDEFHNSAHFVYEEEPTKFVHDVQQFLICREIIRR